MRRLPAVLLILLAVRFYATRSGAGIGVGTFAGAQDEAHYSNAALRMARHGEWLTPYFMDRFYLYKPPLVYWLSAASVKLTGVSADALRRPAKLASATVLLFVFLLAGNGWAGLAAAAALTLSPLFGDLGARNMTDALLCLWIVLAAWLISQDRRFERASTWVGLGVVTGLAILTKSTAGLIPLLLAGALWLVDRDLRSLARIAGSAAVASAVAAPWFVYQSLVHPRWFWAEFVEIELLAYGAGTPPQYIQGSAPAFYRDALLAGALLPLAASLVSLLEAALGRSWTLLRREQPLGPAGAAVLAWLVVMVAAIASFQYRNNTYLLPVIPALAILAGQGRLSRAGVFVAFPLIAFSGSPPETDRLDATRSALQQYCEMRRPNELVIAGAVDSFHAAVLPLARLRYAFPGEGQPPKGFALDFRSMGIVMPVSEFLELERHRPRYAAVMRDWGLPNDAPLATVVAFPTEKDLTRLVESSPDRDFLLPQPFPSRSHRHWTASSGRTLLLGRDAPPRPSLPWACRM